MLVAYASRYGSTKGVAERVAAGLLRGGVRADAVSVAQTPEPGAYDAVVFGSPVFDQRWMPEADAFVRRNLGTLGSRPVWLFSVGTFGDGKRLIGPLMKREPKGIRDTLEAIRPRDYRVFAGVIDRHQWPFFSHLFYYAFGGRLGDNRDWKAIDAWTEGIVRALRSHVAPQAGEARSAERTGQ